MNIINLNVKNIFLCFGEELSINRYVLKYDVKIKF